jgi:hypothetical protein
MGLFGGFALPMSGTGGTASPGTTCVFDYTSNGTYTKTTGAQYVEMIVIAGGGGGGNGINGGTSVNGSTVLGGAGGGGGGIGQQTFSAASVNSPLCVIVGSGGAASTTQAGLGGNSTVCNTGVGVCITANGGKGGYGGADLYPTYGAYPSGSFSNGGTPCQGGAGNLADGNDGGQAFYRSSPFTLNALSPTNCSSPYTTRAGGAGGSAQYPSSNGSASSPSTAQSICGIDLTNYGKGGNGGNSRFGGATNGTAGSAGFVRIIEYF